MNTFWRRVIPTVIRERWAIKAGIAVLVILLFIGGVGALMYVQTTDQLTQDAQDQMETAANTQATALSQWMEQLKSEAHTLAFSAPVQNGEPQQISTYFSQELENENLPTDVLAIHYFDTETSAYRASSATDSVDANPQQQTPWAQQSLALGDSEIQVSDPYTAPSSQTPVIAVIAAVPNQENRALVMLIDLENHATGMARPVQNSFTKVVNSDGTTVLSHRSDQILTQNMGEQDVESVDSMAVKNGLEGQSGYMEMNMGGETMTMGYAPVEGTDWVLMTHSPKSTMFALQQQVSQNLLILLAGAMLGFVLLGITVGRNTIREINRLKSKAATLEQGTLDIELHSDRIDEIGQLYAAFGNMRDSLRERIREAEQATEQAQQAKQQAEQAQQEAEREQQRSEELVQHLETTADAYSMRMERAADGDLSVRLDTESESAAMSQIAEAFNAMMADLEDTIIEIRSFADEVAAVSEEVTAGTEESQSASEQVGESVQKIATDAETQSENLQAVASEMQSLSGTIEEVASSADELAVKTEQTAERGQRGRSAASAAMDEMDAIEAQTDKTIDEVNSLATEMDEIGEIVELITEIAEQTNMLALNASIEAARAGEAGEGFAVVADEIKQLAQEVGDATDEVETLIREVQSSTDTVVGDIKEMDDRVASGTATIEESVEALEEVADNVEDANQSVQEISDATDDQASSTEEVASMIDEVADAAEQVSAESDNVSAAAEEQTSSLTQVSQSAQTLAEQADELQTKLATFTVSQMESPTSEGL